MSGQRFVTRIAPSPTGIMHLGTARTAYVNYLAAKASGGKFILRIDDTDVERNKKEYTDIIFQSLEWLGLLPDKVEYQSERIKLYQAEARGLLYQGKAVELDNGAIALLAPSEMPKQWYDTITGFIKITDTNIEQIHKKIILLRGYKKDECGKIDYKTLGLPTYQFASVIDDYFLDINYIIRGVDHITNTPKQIAIWQALNEVYGSVCNPKSFPKFAHLGLIMGRDPVTNKPKKLSKRDPEQKASLLDYKNEGYTPEALLNWMLLMGWALKAGRSPEEQREANKPINKEKALVSFFDGTLKNSPCNLDLGKLKSLQEHYNV